jgi:rubrerythrin
MSIGALLIGLAGAILAVSYITQPFSHKQAADVDQVIDRWVADARRKPTVAQPTVEQERAAQEKQGVKEEAINFCPQCGRRVASDHRFCPGCGTKLH